MPDRSNVQFRALRRAAGLTQEDIAVLLGLKGSSLVSRYEKAVRSPDLSTAFACERILGAPASALFAPLYADAARVVAARANMLLSSLHDVARDERQAPRLAHLSRLAQEASTLFDA